MRLVPLKKLSAVGVVEAHRLKCRCHLHIEPWPVSHDTRVLGNEIEDHAAIFDLCLEVQNCIRAW